MDGNRFVEGLKPQPTILFWLTVHFRGELEGLIWKSPAEAIL